MKSLALLLYILVPSLVLAESSSEIQCSSDKNIFIQTTANFQCFNCLSRISNKQSGETTKISLSEKWITLLELMSRSCADSKANNSSFRKTSDLLSQFGQCLSSTYEFEKSEENEIIKNWTTGKAKLNYTDPQTTQDMFQKTFGLSYSAALFYFCQLPETEPQKKLDRINRYDTFVTDDFQKCAKEALDKQETHPNCSLLQIVSPSPETKSKNFFSVSSSGTCEVLSKMEPTAETDDKSTKETYQWACQANEVTDSLPTASQTPKEPEKETTNQESESGEDTIETAPLGFPTEYPK